MAWNPFRRRLFRHWATMADAWEASTPAIREATGLRIWNPQRYGLPVYERFSEHYAPSSAGALLAVGLNPGKYGMAQTGLPFTDVYAACNFLPKLGFEKRVPGLAPESLRPFLLPVKRERSCQSVYAFLELAYGSAERGWRDFYVSVPCGLLFLDAEGNNVTPAASPLASLPDVRALRERAIREAIEAARPRAVLFLGKDVARIGRALAEDAVGADRLLELDHPVARGPGRRGPRWWAETVTARLENADLLD